MIYLDNAATSFPKPYCVVNAVREAFLQYGANPGRGGYQMSLDTAERIFRVRENFAKTFHSGSPERVVFTQNCTHALNLALKCFLPKGAHIVVSDREHNSVMRPLEAMAAEGLITYSVAEIGRDVVNTAAYFARKINQNTAALLCVHTSNVDGQVMPVAELGRLAAKFGMLFIVDAAQAAGSAVIDMAADGIDLLCMPGHKGLFGPSGSGVLLIRDHAPLRTLIEGGTGSDSMLKKQPLNLPEALESGTQAVNAIIGLGEGLRFVNELGAGNIGEHERQLREVLVERTEGLSGLRIYEPTKASGIYLFNFDGMCCERTASELENEGIAVRAGLHCAPSAHEVLGTLPDGAVRISFGIFNDCEQVERTASALWKISKAV
ncbi:MAG TPA: aminotransferase class V-fold PLP-dependent enzyme [Oscillospiraceae bacterium]|nr:aminotransferase class V-fold PLP-dependent enzyme [Oscillospiraceae bacterium]HPF55054.1 aminotransferase class V-fold PLP-dependent enzyme [Clostridiales bacterium]HPK34871.1 aminotransferase class V-fold PLP-dependent enzyme [Oscillospiraceae bacterium]HPR76165.1 aminotransferase class V-fold PLP-dependent enzyme [Oscillospiraceae bacterium]